MRARLPASARLRSRAWTSMVKWWSGNADLHYEVWRRSRPGVVEVGLHFEADALTNARLLAAFRHRARAIAKALPDARIEPWDRGWARVWQPVGTDATAEVLAALVARYVRALEPILRAEVPADVAWNASEPGS